jgi:hypothetical protein
VSLFFRMTHHEMPRRIAKYAAIMTQSIVCNTPVEDAARKAKWFMVVLSKARSRATGEKNSLPVAAIPEKLQSPAPGSGILLQHARLNSRAAAKGNLPCGRSAVANFSNSVE